MRLTPGTCAVDCSPSSWVLLNNVPTIRYFYFLVDRKSRANSYILWNKFQDYQVRFTLTDHFLIKRFDDLTCHLQGSSNLVY